VAAKGVRVAAPAARARLARFHTSSGMDTSAVWPCNKQFQLGTGEPDRRPLLRGMRILGVAIAQLMPVRFRMTWDMRQNM